MLITPWGLLVYPELVHGHEVRVGDLRERTKRGLEASDCARMSTAQHLERDLALRLQIERLEYRGAGAPTEHAAHQKTFHRYRVERPALRRRCALQSRARP
jgi:hypothetical protein